MGTFEAPSGINSELDPRYDAIVSKSLNRRPTARYQSADELRQALEHVASGAAATYEVVDLPVHSKVFQVASVPFECDDMAGFAQALGTVQANADGMFIEYRVCDKLWGKIKSRLNAISIPWNRVAGVEYRRGIFSSKFIIVGDSVSALQNFPHSELGSIAVLIKKPHFELAERLISVVKTLRPGLVSNAENRAGPKDVGNLVLASLLIFFGIFNAGLLAIGQVTVDFHASGPVHTIYAVALAFLFGPVLVAQLVAGIIHAATGNRSAAKIGVLSTMLPVSPLFVFGIPFGYWARSLLNDEPSMPALAEPQTQAKGWGATTLVFLRDARNARAISLLETLGCLVVFGGIAIYWFGLYPMEMRFRIVDTNIDRPSLPRAVNFRLQGLNCFVFEDTSPWQRIRCWSFQRQTIADRLLVSKAPYILGIIGAGNSSEETGTTYMPILSDIALDEFSNRKTVASSEVLCTASNIVLDGSLVAAVEVQKDELLRVNLSSKGDEMARRFASEMRSPSLVGLAVEGWVDGISLSPIGDRKMVFRMSPQSKRSMQSIQAAIRGPSLPSELELVD